MRERTSEKVEAETASELISFATGVIHGSPRDDYATFRTLVEVMSNTNNHAASGHKHESWWATAYCDQASHYAGFTFLDNGVGIFESVPLRMVRRAARTLGLTSNQELLREILKGDIGSRTRLHYRGKGLPAIFDLQRRGRIRNLIIVSNDVFADIENDDFRHLPKAFDGTLLHWELPRDSN